MRRFLLIFLLCCSGWAMAAPSNDLLQQFVETVQSAKGEFTQAVLTESGEAAGPKQQGEFSFLRPGKFRWQIQTPYEQLTLSDGKYVFQYDADLAQVIRRSASQTLANSPAAILFGQTRLSDTFKIEALPDKQGLNWLRTTPRDTEAGFSYLDIGFKETLPRQLLLRDSFGQTTHIEFTNFQANPSLDAQEFSFTPPKEAELVEM